MNKEDIASTYPWFHEVYDLYVTHTRENKGFSTVATREQCKLFYEVLLVSRIAVTELEKDKG